MSTSTVGIRLDTQTQNRLKSLGKSRDRSPHYLMKEAVERYLATEESIESERQITAARWQQYEVTGQTISHAEMTDWANKLTNSK